MVETNKVYFLFEMIIFLSLYFESDQDPFQLDNILFPTSLTLLNQNIFIVESNGIHYYYTPELVEDNNKSIIFENNLKDESETIKVAMAQFLEKDNGYIMILAKEIIYFFESNGTIINDTDLKDIINSDQYCLIPFKKENNYLLYLIVYQSDGVIILKLFRFNINTHENDVILSNNYEIYVQSGDNENTIPSKIMGLNCFFKETSIRDYDILTCFYSIHFPTEIHSRSFDSNNSFTELTDLFHYYYKSIDFPIIFDILTITNLEKQKVLLLCICEHPFWMTFNFDDLFSEPKLIFNDSSTLVQKAHKSKLYYFRQTHEFLFSSLFSQCSVLVMIFNNDFTLKEKGFSSIINN